MSIEETSAQLRDLLNEKDPPSETRPKHWPGERLQEGVAFEDYQAIDAVNFSTLKLMAESPLAYWDAITKGSIYKSAFGLGHAAHTAILEPRRFLERYVVQPTHRTDESGKSIKFVRNGRHWDAFERAHVGKTIITQADYDAAWDIQERVRKHPAAARALSVPGRFEVALTWVHKPTGLRCKCRLDHLSIEGIDDLKTAVNVDPRRFTSASFGYAYHWQAAMYRDAVEALTGERLPVRFIAVQNHRPYDTVVHRCDAETLRHGREGYTSALEKVARCKESGVWPGISDEEIDLSPPAWLEEDIQISDEEVS